MFAGGSVQVRPERCRTVNQVYSGWPGGLATPRMHARMHAQRHAEPCLASGWRLSNSVGHDAVSGAGADVAIEPLVVGPVIYVQAPVVRSHHAGLGGGCSEGSPGKSRGS